MKINTALILCAGYGKRLNPLTLDIPKPLLEINEITLLENTINLLQDLGIKKIILNTFYLKKKIYKFIKKKDFQCIYNSILDFKCNSDMDCNGQGYCNSEKCICLQDHNFLPDCSFNGSKNI